MVVEGPYLNEGAPSTSYHFGRGLSQPITVSTSQSRSMPPVFRPVGKSSHNARVILANMEKKSDGKVHFTEIAQTFVPIVETQANVSYILQEIRKEWNDYDNLQLVTNDGLPLTDNEGTRGMKFWKNGRRKIFAIDVDAATTQDNHRKRKRSSASFDSSHESLEEVKEDISIIKENIAEILNVTSFQKIPVGLQRVLIDAFKCKICAQVSHPPIVVMKCCKVIMGCSSCSETWFSGEEALTKCCPLCRAERGYGEVMTLRGVDELLATLRHLWEPDDNDTESQQD